MMETTPPPFYFHIEAFSSEQHKRKSLSGGLWISICHEFWMVLSSWQLSGLLEQTSDKGGRCKTGCCLNCSVRECYIWMRIQNMPPVWQFWWKTKHAQIREGVEHQLSTCFCIYLPDFEFHEVPYFLYLKSKIFSHTAKLTYVTWRAILRYKV